MVEVRVVELSEIVHALADAITVVDGRCPAYVTRSGRTYQPGLGPYAENAAMALVTEHLSDLGIACGQFVPYPEAPRRKCDIWIGEPTEWVAEVKMGRFRGDNGKPDDTGIKDLLSPFRADRSALSDAFKLAESSFASRKAIVVYGFDDEERPLEDALGALDLLLRHGVEVIERNEAPFHGLRHPVFRSGRVAAWEIA